MIRVIQIACIAITAGILWAIGRGLLAVADWGGPGFVDGAIFGALFVVGVIALIMWIDPSSRPRGNASDKQSTDNRVH